MVLHVPTSDDLGNGSREVPDDVCDPRKWARSYGHTVDVKTTKPV